jgi:hypothetical protein
VILVDADLLLYAYHPRAEQHAESRAWLGASGDVTRPPYKICCGAEWQTREFARANQVIK